MSGAWFRVVFLHLSSSSNVIYECRHCGQAVDDKATVCPACGHTGIATYELD